MLTCKRSTETPLALLACLSAQCANVTDTRCAYTTNPDGVSKSCGFQKSHSRRLKLAAVVGFSKLVSVPLLGASCACTRSPGKQRTVSVQNSWRFRGLHGANEGAELTSDITR